MAPVWPCQWVTLMPASTTAASTVTKIPYTLGRLGLHTSTNLQSLDRQVWLLRPFACWQCLANLLSRLFLRFWNCVGAKLRHPTQRLRRRHNCLERYQYNVYKQIWYAKIKRALTFGSVLTGYPEGIYLVDNDVHKANSSLNITEKCALGRPWNDAHRSIFAFNYLDDSIQPGGETT